MTRLLVARHGQSEWNAAGRWQGQADPPLSPLGRRQAEVAATVVAEVDVVVTSDLERARHTGEIIAGARSLPLRTDPDLRERHAGEWQGLTRAEIEERWPGWLEAGRRPPGWEADDELATHARRALDRLGGHHETVLVVAHGGVIYSLEAAQGAPFERIPNLGARWFRHDGRDLHLGERVVLAADEATLQAPDLL